MKITLRYGLAALVAGLALVAGSASAAPRIVDCDAGDSLQEAIDAGAGSAKPIDIILSGNCYETIRITRDNVSIEGDYDATIIGQVRLFAADNIYMENVKLTGPGDGLRMVNGRVRLSNVHIAQNEGAGISVRQGGVVVLTDSTVEYNAGPGVFIDNSSSRIRFSTIEHNGEAGIVVTNNGFLAFDFGMINYHENGQGINVMNGAAIDVAETHIGWNNPHGIELSLGSTGVLSNAFANGNAQIGILLDSNSALRATGGMMSWNDLYGALVMAHSTLTIEGTFVEGNTAHGIVVETDSALFAQGASHIRYNTAGDNVQVECRDKESSVAIDGSVVIDPPLVNCPDPDF